MFNYVINEFKKMSRYSPLSRNIVRRVKELSNCFSEVGEKFILFPVMLSVFREKG
jgi:hypothetical protein